MKWEYMTHDAFKSNREWLNRFGNDEWELVSCILRDSIYEYIFKRPKREIPEPKPDKPDKSPFEGGW